MTKNLNDRFVAGLRSATRENYFDTKAKGLVLRVSPRAKVWYFTYRNGGPSQWLKIGEYPAVSLASARTAALDHRHSIDVEGKDPAAERRAPAPTVYTFANFVPVFIDFQKGRIKGWKDQENKIAKHLTPAWGDRALSSLTRRDVQERLSALVVDGLKGGVTGIQALISRMFTIALNLDLISHHPAARIIKRFPGNPGQRKLSDAELRALWAGLEAQPGAASDAMKLRLLLGQRGQETAGTLWSELDLEAGVWSLPRERTKNKQPHMIGLPPTAWALLRAQRQTIADGELRVFPRLTLTGDAHKALAVIHGGTYEWKDVRRTVATRLGDLGYENDAIDRIQNRKQYSVTALHYNHAQYVESIRAALTAWDVELRRILANKPKKKAAVLRMRGR